MRPFPGGIDDLQNGTLILSVAAAFLYLLMMGRPVSWRRTMAKAGSIALLAALAFDGGAQWLLVAALGLSAAGDAALAQDGGVDAHDATPTPSPSPQGGGESRGSSGHFSVSLRGNWAPRGNSSSPLWGGVIGGGSERFFLAGLAAFLVAHVAYAALFLSVGDGRGAYQDPWRMAVAAAVVLLAAFLVTSLWRAVEVRLRLPIALYGAALAAMVLSALTVPSAAVIAGALLFLVSDALLAWQRFLGGRQRLGPAVWITYYAAQLLIVLGFLLS